jgi:uncharacterized Zn finger protein (UPF0148 family)
MTSAEFELHMALSMIQTDECPHCGVEPRDLMEYNYGEVKCPVCKNSYGKVRRWGFLVEHREASAV